MKKVNILKKVKVLFSQRKYSEILRLTESPLVVAAIENGVIHPEILVWKGRSILLSDDTTYKLSDVEKAYRKAIHMDENCTEALIELGFYYLNIMDNAKKAEVYFSKAINIYRERNTEVAIGMADTIMETQSSPSAAKFLKNSGTHLLDTNAIKKNMRRVRKNEIV
ncbi:MAG: hypothetical protein IAF08_13615 [Rhizobacter sp.]|nr:hypothetical protein [Chlorobiales bacterium]